MRCAFLSNKNKFKAGYYKQRKNFGKNFTLCEKSMTEEQIKAPPSGMR